jgi:hypothetical protein
MVMPVPLTLPLAPLPGSEVLVAILYREALAGCNPDLQWSVTPVTANPWVDRDLGLEARAANMTLSQ